MAKMHQIRLRLGSAPDPAGGAHSAPPHSLPGFKGPTSKGEKGREGGGKDQRGGKKNPPFKMSAYGPGITYNRFRGSKTIINKTLQSLIILCSKFARTDCIAIRLFTPFLQSCNLSVQPLLLNTTTTHSRIWPLM